MQKHHKLHFRCFGNDRLCLHCGRLIVLSQYTPVIIADKIEHFHVVITECILFKFLLRVSNKSRFMTNKTDYEIMLLGIFAISALTLRFVDVYVARVTITSPRDGRDFNKPL